MPWQLGYDRGFSQARAGGDEESTAVGMAAEMSGPDFQDEVLLHGQYREWLRLLAPVLAPYDPAAFTKIGLVPPGPSHWLGTDEIGSDVLSRLLFAARLSLGVGVVAMLVAVCIGTGVGLAAGFAGGAVDAVLMRLVDLLLAFPRLFLALLVIALWGPSIGLVILVLGITGWMTTARLVRALKDICKMPSSSTCRG